MENLLWRNSKWASKLVAMTIACLAVVWVAVPFLWAICNSLKTHGDIFRDVSKEVEEAARIEGASLWQIFWMIALPLSLDGLIVTAFIVFAFCWNEALFASAVTSQHAATMPAFILASRSTRGVDFNFAAINPILALQ